MDEEIIARLQTVERIMREFFGAENLEDVWFKEPEFSRDELEDDIDKELRALLSE